jgi:membrane fusion protein
MAVMTMVAAALAALLVAFAAWGHVSRKTRLIGVLMPTAGTLGVQARSPGVVLERHVQEGQQVKAGDILLTLDTEHLSVESSGVHETGLQVERAIAARIESLETQRAVREQQYALRERALADRLHILESQQEQGVEEERLLVQRLRLARASVERQEALSRSGFVSVAQLQAKQDELLDVEGRLQAVRRNLLSIANDRSATATERKSLSLQLKTEVGETDRALQTAREEIAENAARRRTAIAAPVDGVVSAIHLLPGQPVQSGQTVLTLIAKDRKAANHSAPAGLVAHLYAPSRAIGFVREQQLVYLRYEAYPYQKFGMAKGKVIAVSHTPFAPSELPLNIAQQIVSRVGAQEALFRAVVELDSQTIHALGTDWPLKPGLMLDADVKQEERAIWEWLLDPVLSWKRVV